MAIPASHEFYWQSLAQLSSGRVYHTLVEARGQLYVMGGYDETGHPTSALELYCPETDQWVNLPPMPTPRAGAAVAVLGKQLLVVGGVGKDQCPLKTVEIYNTEEGRWKKRSSLREAAMGISVIVKDGRTFAVGGMGADLLPQSHLQQYDLRKDVWAVLPLMPTPRYDTNAHLLGSKIYVSGGRQNKRCVKAFEVFDSETRSWTTLPSLPCKRSYSGVVWDESGRLYWLGGLRQGGSHQSSKFTKNINIFDTNKALQLKNEAQAQALQLFSPKREARTSARRETEKSSPQEALLKPAGEGLRTSRELQPRQSLAPPSCTRREQYPRTATPTTASRSRA